MDRFCDIKNRNELADYLKIPRSKLSYLLFIEGIDKQYHTFEIPKKHGGTRTICAPSEDLKGIQRRLASALSAYRKALLTEQNLHPSISHGFEKGKSTITNAKLHRNKRFVLNLDLEDFFPTFHFGRVLGYFKKNRDFQFPHEVAVTIAQLTCYQGHLPQGAPTSPVIANLIFQILDMRILKIAQTYRLDYTRYADDLTFSTSDRSFPEHYERFLKSVTAELGRGGFAVNQKKTRLQFRDSRQEVTGLVVNQKIHVSQEYYKQTRAMAHHLYTQGSCMLNGTPMPLAQLEGRFSYIDQLERYNNRIDGAKHSANVLNARERQYQAFLFYKYFFANEKPLILTEGKTDILYLRAAMKALQKDYPKLITVDQDGGVSFHISFFRRSKRWQYFFGMSPDGADAMKTIYQYFVSGRNTPNYLSYFSDLCGHPPRHPVVFLYDNETVSDRPLKTFLKKEGKSIDRARLQADLYAQLLPKSNLYLLTNPLVSGKAECEIEDLFDAKTLGHTINGRSFSPADDYDKEKTYGKDLFSKYVLANFRTIDFSNFRPLLEALNALIG